MTLADIAAENLAADSRPLSVLDAEQLTRKHTHSLHCTFDDGAITQRIFACIHCMRRAAASDNTNTLPPHFFGVCEACFDVCHRACGARSTDDLTHVAQENVDFFAMERKRDFRCDCGTAAAPSSTPCLWKLPTKSEGLWSVPEDAIRATRARAADIRAVRNPNRYDQSFLGKYCWCAQPWSFHGDNELAMRQCEICSEWYHEQRCLRPADNRYCGAAPFAMLCRTCVPKYAVLHPYLALASERAPADDSNDDENRRANDDARQTLAALLASHANGGDCHRPPPLTADVRTDVNLFANFAELLCDCDTCDAALRDAGLHFLLEEEPTESECEETVAPEDVPLVELVSSSTRDMSFAQQHLAGAFVSDFRASLSAIVANKAHGEPLTEADIAEFRRHMDAALAARRNSRQPPE